MKRIVYLSLLQLMFFAAKAQCPQILDGNNNPSSNPYWISCSGGAYSLNFESPSSWGTYTISWGDATPDQVGGSYTANTIINHVYGATVDTFIVTLTIPSQLCIMTGVVVMEQAVVAALAVPSGGTLEGCSPANITFSNVSTNVSPATHFYYDFGDNTPFAYDSYTNTSASNLYSAANVTCATNATLYAWNYCSMSVTSTAVMGPIHIYDRDVASISVANMNKCWPDNAFTFSNTSIQNCTAFGNNYQRKQFWRLGNYWPVNSFADSIIPWTDIPPASPITVAFPNFGGYVVMLKDSNVCGVDSITQLVNIFNAPTASMVAPAGPFCVGNLMTFTNASSMGAFYKWDMGDGSGMIPFPFGPKTYAYAFAGTYTVKLVAYIPFGGACSDTDQVVITVGASPNANFTMSPAGACGTLSNVTFTDTSTGGPVTWDWDFGNTFTSNLQNPPPQTYGVPGIFLITLTVTSGPGCSSIATQTVEVYPIPTASFNSGAQCLNFATQFADASNSPVTMPISSWIWDFGDATPLSFLQNPSHTYTAAGVYTVTFSVFNAQCSDTYTQTILVLSNPTASFVMTPTAGCSPVAVSFTNLSTGAANYVWDFGDASPYNFNINPTYTYTGASPVNITYTVKLIAMNNSGCGDSLKLTVTKYASPVPSFTSSYKAGCPPFVVTFTNTSSTYTSIAWSFGNTFTSSATTTVATTYTSASGSSLVVSPIKLVATSANGCKDSVMNAFTIFAKPLAAFTVDTPACSKKIVTFTNQSTPGPLTYSWNFGGAGASTFADPTYSFVNLTSAPITSVTQLVAFNGNGCSDTLKVNVVVYPQPTVSFTSSKDSGCAALKVVLLPVGAFSTYSWTLGNGLTSTAASGTNTTYYNATTNTKLYTVKLSITDAKGCPNSATKVIKVFPKPNALFDASPLTAYTPSAAVSFTNLSTGATTYTWNFGDGSNSNAQTPSAHLFVSPQVYTISLMVASSQGCRDTFEIKNIEVLDGTVIQIPNAFTPNVGGSKGGFFDPNDLSNDIFHPNVKGPLEYRLSIYSRWGELVFDTKNHKEGWDGYYHGKLCDSDVYAWKLHVKLSGGEVIEKKGDVTLLR